MRYIVFPFLLIVLAGAGCFSPTYEEGIFCSSEGECPGDLICDPVDQRCRIEPLPAACDDSFMNGSETDIDCGGSCAPCADGLACEAPSDCMSQVCTDLSCAVPVCGDGVVNQPSEACDEGGPTPTCKADCTLPTCGDGFIDLGEECDDMGETAVCDDDCTGAFCGDGTYNQSAGEECDGAGDTPTCDADCTAALCGDGTTNGAAGEDCDEEGETATCDADCTVAVCGDGTINVTAGEACDAAGDAVDCDGDCTLPICGDSYLNTVAGETCDDGGDSSTCDGDCTLPSCGDGYTNAAAGEECDDGNTTPGDGCDDQCQAEYCVRVTNTPAEDLLDNSWFDSCVDEVGNTVTVRLRDSAGQVVYEASGQKVGTWTYDNITSTFAANGQYNHANHDRLITLDNGDHLQIAGRFSNNAGCGGDLGNGYGMTIYGPTLPNPYYDAHKLTLFPYRGYIFNAGSARAFGTWSPGHEISWLGGAPMSSCHPLISSTNSPLVGFDGTLDIIISP